ncbi:hypothetical protein [Enterococcus sp. DIV1059_2]|uniref:hypothetical protein n=1 Tax=Enterococcus sp. DIV1059_2 TaxID=2774664 RepID=UPI003F1F5B22
MERQEMNEQTELLIHKADISARIPWFNTLTDVPKELSLKNWNLATNYPIDNHKTENYECFLQGLTNEYGVRCHSHRNPNNLLDDYLHSQIEFDFNLIVSDMFFIFEAKEYLLLTREKNE